MLYLLVGIRRGGRGVKLRKQKLPPPLSILAPSVFDTGYLTAISTRATLLPKISFNLANFLQSQSSRPMNKSVSESISRGRQIFQGQVETENDGGELESKLWKLVLSSSLMPVSTRLARSTPHARASNIRDDPRPRRHGHHLMVQTTALPVLWDGWPASVSSEEAYVSRDEIAELQCEIEEDCGNPKAHDEWPFDSSWFSSENIGWDSWDDWTDQDDNKTETPLTSQNSHHLMRQEDGSDLTDIPVTFIEERSSGRDQDIATESSTDGVPWSDDWQDCSDDGTEEDGGGIGIDGTSDMHEYNTRWSSPWSDFSDDKGEDIFQDQWCHTHYTRPGC
ncbi:hypothetical protein SODALDRAFT_40647 [Sodiomyces alkalinus F11]|uniref:Uncharacterized protein n=1 Tax=Sodiomyces alkalinus (strain CBS 110278 / VKM F-3762 / F11) TaxID=1314773 RepID=A0A3N2Q9S3_SODAK|nr:hypothetical protein SODALDRAFT_40647 [Sodiomyces alkalinus F11]ROT43500.1 hypothetical protein SODALDRAFT_40647 [Sodiomyces alkalinus F11]